MIAVTLYNHDRELVQDLRSTADFNISYLLFIDICEQVRPEKEWTH